MSKASKADKKAIATVDDSYDEYIRDITDQEAHRDVVYELPSYIMQVKECLMVQMKRYTKQKVIWIAAVFVLLIPIIFLIMRLSGSSSLPDTDNTNLYISSLLSFMPLIIPLLAAIACGSMLSQEFNERTVYLSLPLPMPRSAFYLGKFLAGLVLIEGVLTAAYGLCMILAMTATTNTYTKEIFGSMLVAMFYVLFCCSLTYFLSTKLKRGSTMLPFIILFMILPLVSMGLASAIDAGWAAAISSYIPTFAPETALYSLGNYTPPISIYGLASAITQMSGSGLAAAPGKSAFVMIFVCLVLSVIMLVIGNRIVQRRDM